ncbi:MerR family transcriptional regulator [Streptomyces sp. NBC_01218]|uniref:DNA polymerase III subunit beta family protein n=1 Tax=unclassified Streptomyces TaxID=2593676 RepID=UPI0023B9F0D1|nr:MULTISPECIES: MerR family transcriptional regulator [unclassified Streptomyces]WEH38968.1 MerR family transcriptional regulator [Streptomyces sp. AM 2-1-1]WSQ50628.1 MerR family transcriptional regulator [Streptomyces sp. NBC_01218]
MDDTDALMSIGAFARRVGLAPSALRFYDDCDVLPPAHVDPATGYRYYSPGQERRALLVRRLREAGMPLTDASVVLGGSRDEARAVLEAHARRARETAVTAQSAIEEILRELPGGPRRTTARIGGAELAGAVRQVAPAVASGPAAAEFPVLGCVLLELDGQEVRLVATDRYRLAVRALRSFSGEGDPCAFLVGAEELREAAAWAAGLLDLRIEADRQSVRLLGAGTARDLATVDGTFPEYRPMLDGLPAARHRIIVDRAVLRAAVAGGVHDGPVVLRTRSGEQRLTVAFGDTVSATPAALCTGPSLRIAFDPAVLLPSLDAGVGPDILLEITGPDQPVVVRSADQGSFTTLVMPVHAPAEN